MALEVIMPTLYDKQRDAIFDPARFVCIEASTKSGKTLGCLVWQGARVLNDRRRREHWWIAPVYQQANIAFERAKEMMPRSEYTKNESDMTLRFRNGARWSFRSGEKPDNLYGEDVADAVIDEASRCREEAWHAIRSTLTATRGPARLIGNVKGRKNFFYRLCRQAEQGLPGMSYHKLIAHDAIEAGILEADEIEAARRELPDHVFRELYLAEPADDGGNPFGIAAIEACRMPTASTEATVAYGVDLAKYTDWTWIIGIDQDGRQTYSERFQADWQQTTRRILAAVGAVPTFVDSTGVGDPIVEALQRERYTIEGFRFTSTSKQQLMEGLAAAIQQARFGWYDPLLGGELESFGYEYTRSGVRYSAPQGLHDDGVCSAALAVQRKGEPAWLFQ